MSNNVINFSTSKQKERIRAIEICNACRYCESICPVFPEITRFKTFTNEDMTYFANLCHNCKGCYHGCQYAPPHEFDLNIPKIFAEVRVESYTDYAFPSFLGKLFAKNGTVVSIVIALSIALALIAGILFNDANSLFTAFNGEGSFYKVIPYGIMTGVSMLICLNVVIAFFFGFKNFWNSTGNKMSELLDLSIWIQALRDIATLRHMGGGDDKRGCTHTSDKYTQARRYYHHALMYGFIGTFIATCLAAFYHYALHLQGPYDYFSAPVIFGTLGGILMIIGTVGLSVVKVKMDEAPVAKQFLGMEYSFIFLLFFVSLTGLILLFVRETIYMPMWLCIHLGFVLAFFLILPYCKFVHALYRFAALLKYAKNKKNDSLTN